MIAEIPCACPDCNFKINALNEELFAEKLKVKRLREPIEDFIRKCETGRAISKDSYGKFKEALKKTEAK